MKKICPRCEGEHEKPGKYCSRTCANSRTFTKETNEKKRTSALNFYASMSESERISFHKKQQAAYDFEGHQRKVQEANQARSWSRPYEEMAHGSLRKRLLIERNETCEDCGIHKTYNGKPISLELEHIDGDNSNNKIENLKILCPNCHSQTPTFRARNIRVKRLKKESLKRESS